MIHYLARRLLLLVPVLAGVSVVVFLVLHAVSVSLHLLEFLRG